MTFTNYTATQPTQARPYARAVFAFALAEDALEQWGNFLELAAEVVQNEQMQSFLAHPKFVASQKADFLLELLKHLGIANGSLGASQRNFIHLLAQNGRFLLLPSICALYYSYLANLNQVISAKVVSAFPVEPKQQARLLAALEKKFQSRVVVSYEEDKSLIGGASVFVGDEVIDLSVRGRLTQLRKSL